MEVGQVARPQGVRGELRVRLHWSRSQTLGQVAEVTLEGEGERVCYAVERARQDAKGAFVIKLRGCDTREAADQLRGRRVLVQKAFLPRPAPGEYYLADLVGCRVVVGAAPLGEVIAVEAHPTLDSMLIRTASGNIVEQPLTPPWIARVDTGGGLVVLHSADGLIR